ncbi:MAG: 4Fe-4S binding protein [Syntrophobacter sp.]
MDSPDRSESLPVLVVGSGVAGLTAALDLARIGVPVHVVEREGHLGGQVMHLDKLYPSDHCAFCPVWTEGAACLTHPLITLHSHTTLEGLESADGRIVAVLATRPPAVSPDACVFCGACKDACDRKGVPGAIRFRPEALAWDPALPPTPFLDKNLCSRCGQCASACPTGAIDPNRLDLPARVARMPVADVIHAVGFTERSSLTVTEYHADGHPDVFSAMDYEAWTAEAGPNAGTIRRRSNGAIPRSVAFIQCAGARDQRFLGYCSSVCCMHALKQARWVKRRQPAASVAIFFTDLRAVGKGYESYARTAATEAVTLVRSRPALVFSLPEAGGGSTLAVRYEDFTTGKVITAEFDTVVLNGGLTACPLPGVSGAGTGNQSRDVGAPVTSAGGQKQTQDPAHQTCGFCQEPGDVAQSVIQGSRAAALVAARLMNRAAGGVQ